MFSEEKQHDLERCKFLWGVTSSPSTPRLPTNKAKWRRENILMSKSSCSNLINYSLQDHRQVADVCFTFTRISEGKEKKKSNCFRKKITRYIVIPLAKE
ncbi:hypothetical protein CDAR_85201 [Caerostris darwini]|uniref:Uncharacterized protein n=1 Tax=Caerostris darwini TaxID=1538125 RepID=A0AAV4N0V3_9ARAC|nr:hypothetical protein CDAR_85201 [Caerostris darwini]